MAARGIARRADSRCIAPPLLIALIGICWGTLPARAGVNHWTSHGPRVGSFSDIATDPHDPSVLWALVLPPLRGASILHKSVDAGATWLAKNPGPPGPFLRIIQMDPTNSSRIYVAGGSGIFRSDDAGETWRTAHTGIAGTAVDALAVDSRQPNVLYASNSESIFKTSDRGASWSSASGDLTAGLIRGITVDANDSNVLYASVSGVVYKSSDGGIHWSSASIGIPPSGFPVTVVSTASDPALYAYRGANLFRSTNGAALWVLLDVGFEVSFISALLVDPREPKTLYVGSGRGIFRSRDGGVSWASFNDGLTNLFVGALALDSSSRRLFAGTESNAHRRNTSGGSWSPARSGLTGVFTSALSFAPRDEENFYAAWTTDFLGSFLGHSANGGGSWLNSNSATPSFVTSLAVSAQSSKTVYAGTLGSGVQRTTNGGGDWEPFNDGLTNLRVRRLVLANPNSLYAMTDSAGIFVRNLEGGSWTLHGFGGIGTSFTDLAVDPSNPDRLFAANGGAGAFRSLDRGQTWLGINTGLTERTVLSIEIDPRNPSIVYAGTQNGLFKTEDGGSAWRPANVGLPVSGIGIPITVTRIVVDPANPATLFVGTLASNSFADPLPGGVFRSADRGETWVPWNRGLANTFIRDLTIDRTGTSLHAATEGGVYDFSFSSASYFSSSFFTVNPCRVVDTRDTAGGKAQPLQAGFERIFPLAGNCGIPATAKSVALNITVSEPTFVGHLELYEAGRPAPGTFSISYRVGQTRSNNAIVTLDSLGRLAVRCAQPEGSVHVILDVYGYFQ